MKEFFHGWRRKAGLVTLGLAMALFGAWMRSLCVVDCLQFDITSLTNTDTRHARVLSVQGRVYCTWWQNFYIRPRFDWMTYDVLDPYTHEEVSLAEEVIWDGQGWSTSYFSLTLPLTLLSAYLILWKPRKRA